MLMVRRSISLFFYLFLLFISSLNHNPISLSSMSLMKAEKKHAKFCFQMLKWHLNNHSTSEAKPTLLNSDDISTAMFITWNKSPQKLLRGCLGTLNPIPLVEGLEHYAISAATEDSRFKPVTLEEIPFLSVSVSFLGNFEEIGEWSDWTIGKHGIEIEVACRSSSASGCRKRAIFLPHVPVEHCWSKRETIEKLMQKATSEDVSFEDLVRVVRFQSSMCTFSYQECIDVNERI